MSTDFNAIMEGIIRNQLATQGRYSEWFSMTPEEQAQYISTVNQRLTEMQQSTLSVLAAQYYEMESNPVSIDEHLQLLKDSMIVAQGRPDTEANRDYRRQLQIDIDLYTRQQTAMRSFETAWSEALSIVSPFAQVPLDAPALVNDKDAKQGKISARIKQLQGELAAQVKTDTFTENYVRVFSELQAFKHVERNYKALLAAKPGAAQNEALAAMSNVPDASDNAPVNASLLLMEERPGYIRMNVALVNASYGGQYKDMFLDNGRLVLPKEGMLNFSFGTTARSLAWQEQYRVKNEPGVSPTFTPIRSVLMRTEFVEKYFGHYLVSENSMRNGFNIQPLDDQTGIKLTSVDRKIPNQIGIAVGEITPPPKNTVEEVLKVKPADLEALINDYADIKSFQTIAMEGFRHTYYSAARDGAFVNISDLEQSIGFVDRLYLLEKPEGGGYVGATPFMSVTRQKNNTLTSKLLSQAETRELYAYNLEFFERLEALQDGRQGASPWFNDPQQRSQFEAQLTRTLERNHMTPGGIVLPTAEQGNDQRDIKGNNLNKVLWEKDFGKAVWQHDATDDLLFGLSQKLSTTIAQEKLISLRKNGYLDSDLAAAKQVLPDLYQALKLRAQAEEQAYVNAENSKRDPRDKRPPLSVNLSAIEGATSDKLVKLLLSAPPYLQISDTALRSSVAAFLETTAGKSLRKQVLFHVLRPVAETAAVSSPNTTYAHSGMEGHDGPDVSINNRVAQPDPYLILNAKFESLAYQEGNYVILDDKYQSYSQFVPDTNKNSTLYMRDLDTPFVGGISGTTKMVTKALSGKDVFGRALTLKEYWQFQMANAAFMIRNGYHSFFETLYVAARYEPTLPGGVGHKLLDMFDRYRVLGAGSELQGSVYEEVMALVLPVVNQGLPAAEQFNAPSYDRFGPRLQPLGSESLPYRTLQEKIQLVGEVYERLTRELRLGDEVLTPGFKQLSTAELAALDLAAAKLHLKSELDNILGVQRRQGFAGPLDFDDAQRDRIADLAVEGILRQDFGKRSELMLYLESLGFSFAAKGNPARLLTFWSDDFQGYKSVLDGALTAQGKAGIATDYDVAALDFVHQLRNTLVGHAKGGPLADAAFQGSLTVAGFLSSVYAASTADLGGTVYVMSKGGLKVNSYFWNAELPILRALQKAGVVGELKVLHEPYGNYEGKPLTDIGSPLTSADVKVLANPKYLPPAFADEMNAAAHKRWVESGPRAILISLHQEVKRYIDTHTGSGRNAAMIALLKQTTDKLLELNAMDALSASERIAAARGDLVMPGALWSTAELVKQASVFGKRQGESYVSIQHLLDSWHASTKRGAFTFAGDPNKLYLELPFKGNVLERYTDQLQRLLPFDLLRSAWDIEVDNKSAEGLLILKNRAGATTEVRFEPATTVEQKRAQQRQLASLQRLMLVNFSAETLPATLSIQGAQIFSGTRVLATLANGVWATDEAAISAVQRVASGPLADAPLHNQQVGNWSTVVVHANPEGGDSQYRAQIIIQSENDPAVAKAAANLAGKHPDKSLVVQLDASGQMRLVHGDPGLFQNLHANDKVRWQVVGHGRGPVQARTLGGLDAEQWAMHLDRFQQALHAQYGIGSVPARISLVGCSLEDAEQQAGFGRQLVAALQTPGLEVSVRSANVSVDSEGRKLTLDTSGEWVHSDGTNKRVLSWTRAQGVLERDEYVAASVLLGREGIDVVALLDDLGQGRIKPEQLGAAQEYALSRLFPGADERLDQAALRALLDNPLKVAQLQDALDGLVKRYQNSTELESVGARQMMQTMLDEQQRMAESGLASAEGERFATAMLDNVLDADVDRSRIVSHLDPDSHVERLHARNRQQLLAAGNVLFDGPAKNAFGQAIAVVQGSLPAVLLHDMGLLVDGKPLTAGLLASQGGKLRADQQLTFDSVRFNYEMSKVPLQPELVELSRLVSTLVERSRGSNVALFSAESVPQEALKYINVLRDYSGPRLEVEIAKAAQAALGTRLGERAQWLAQAGSLSVDERRKVQNLYELARDVGGFDLDRFKRLQAQNPGVSGDQILQSMALDAAENRVAPGQDTEKVLQAARWTEQQATSFMLERGLLGKSGASFNVNRAAFERFVESASGMDRVRLASAMLKLAPDQHLAIKRALEGSADARVRTLVDTVDTQRSSKPSRAVVAADRFGTALDVFETLNSVRDLIGNWQHMSSTDKGLNLTGLIGGVAMSPLSAAIAKAVSAAGKALGAVSSFSKAATVIRGGVLDAALAPVTFAGIGLQWQSFWSGNGDMGSYEYKSLVANTVITTVTTAVSLALTGVSIAASLSSAVAASVLGTLAASAGPIGVAIAAAGFIINGVVQGAMQLAEFGDYFASTADQVAQFFAAWVGVETDALKRARVEKEAVGAASELRNTLNSDWEKTKLYLSDLFAKDQYGYLNYRDRDNKVAHGTLKSGEDFYYALQHQVAYGAMNRVATQMPNDGGQVWMEMGNQHPDFQAVGSQDKRNLFNLAGQALSTATGGRLSDAFNLDAGTRIRQIDAGSLDPQQLQQGLNENDSLMFDAQGMDVALASDTDGAMTLSYRGSRVLRDGLTNRSGSSRPAVTQAVDRQVRVQGVESYVLHGANKADVRGSTRQEFFDVAGTQVTIQGGAGEGNVYSVNKGNRIASTSNDTALWSAVNATISLQGARNAQGELQASQTLQVSLSSRYSQISLRRNGQAIELNDGKGVLTVLGLYHADGSVDNGKVLQLLDANKYSFSLPGLGLIDDQWRSLETMAKTFVFGADPQRAIQRLSNDQAVNTYALKAGAGHFRAAFHTNQLMQFMLEAPLTSLSFSIIDDMLTIRSNDKEQPLQLSIENYQDAKDRQLLKLWLQDNDDNGKSRLVEIALPAIQEGGDQPLTAVDSHQADAEIDKAMASLVKTHRVASITRLNLLTSTESYEVDALASPQVSLVMPPSWLLKGRPEIQLKQVRLGDDLVLYYANRLSASGLMQTPHLRVRQYFTQPTDSALRIRYDLKTFDLKVAVDQHLGDERNEILDATQSSNLAGGRGSDRYKVDVASTALVTLDNMSMDSKLDTLELRGDIALDRLGLRVVGDDLQLLVFDTPAATHRRVEGGYGTPRKTIVLKNYVVDSRARHLQLELQGQLYSLPEVDAESGYFIHMPQAANAVLGIGIHGLRVSPFAPANSQVVALERPLGDYLSAVGGQGYDLTLVKDGQSVVLRDYYRNPQSVRFSWFDASQNRMQMHANVVFPPNHRSTELALLQELNVPVADRMAFINNAVTSREDIQALINLEAGARAESFTKLPDTQDFSVYVRVLPDPRGEQMLFGTGGSSNEGFQVVIDSERRLGFSSFSRGSSSAVIERVDFGGFHAPAINSTQLDLSSGELVLRFRENRYIDVYAPNNGIPLLLRKYDLGEGGSSRDSAGFARATLSATRGLSNIVRSSLSLTPKVLNGVATDAQMRAIFNSDGDNWGVMSEQAKKYLRVKGVSETVVGELGMGDVLTRANLEKVVDLHLRGQGQLSASFMVDYVLSGRNWILNQAHAEYAVNLEKLQVDGTFITRAFNYGLSLDEAAVYLNARSAAWPGRDMLLNFALALRGDDRNYLDNDLQAIRNSNGIGADNRAKFYFRPESAVDAQVLQAALMHKGYLPSRAEQLAQRMVAIQSLDYRRVDSLLKAGIANDALLGRLVAAGVDGEDVVAGNSERQHYETGSRGERIKVSSSDNLSQFSSRSSSQFYSRQYLRVDGDGNVHQLGDQPYDLASFNQQQRGIGLPAYTTVEQALASVHGSRLRDNFRYTFQPGQMLGANGNTLTYQQIGSGDRDGALALWEQGAIERADGEVPTEQSWFGRSAPGNLVDGFDQAGEAFAWRAASNMGFGDQSSKVADVQFVSGALTPEMEAKASYLRFDLKHKVVLTALSVHTQNSVAQEGQADTTRSGTYRVEALRSGNDWTAVSGELSWSGQQDMMRVAIDTQGVPYQHYRLRGISGSYDRDRWIKEVTFETAAVPVVQDSAGQLAKLSGAMATFPDAGVASSTVTPARQAERPLLTSPLA
ncbi:C80 family cysteine peptidase [Pseudomonas sp. CCOS 191]|uniref:C80 family cysteine peptidase n=1 Tax=Pseudomonas sp. CCOS 191 TaxID=1649877 RepID=UPI0018E68301|nr:C80 family cysteine peptidase [Pseudomonas sp. CCOS 191]MBI6952019.1 hypothetical protein [Pseudomonas sp. CCOS 191]